MDDPTALAWQRYRRLLRTMAWISAAAIALALLWLKATDTPMPLPFVLAVVAAIAGSLMLAAALMGLVFFSAASGADEEAASREPRDP
jgi:hypothetical protein